MLFRFQTLVSGIVYPKVYTRNPISDMNFDGRVSFFFCLFQIGARGTLVIIGSFERTVFVFKIHPDNFLSDILSDQDIRMELCRKLIAYHFAAHYMH